jgi:hypothetical protein
MKEELDVGLSAEFPPCDGKLSPEISLRAGT